MGGAFQVWGERPAGPVVNSKNELSRPGHTLARATPVAQGDSAGILPHRPHATGAITTLMVGRGASATRVTLVR
jgi:hypothetical protein